MESTIADVLYQYTCNRLSEEQIKRIYSASDILNTIEDDDEEEIKEEIWNIVKYSLHWKSLIDMIRMTIQDEEEEEESTEESSDTE
jgi:tetrahydromethanopterin S-methyltransferase subunit A